jgi:hypothetical protein
LRREHYFASRLCQDSGYLQRHYFSLGLKFQVTEQEIEEKALPLDHHWLKKHINNLTGSTLPIEVVDWKQLLIGRTYFR